MQDSGKQGRLCGSPRAGKKKVAADEGNPGWPGWRGAQRDGRVTWLPEKLPGKLKLAWEAPLVSKGLGGVAATREHVLVSDRELMDKFDCFRCFKADTGEQLWSVMYPAEGELDYGPSPRATPLFHKDLVILAGAFGHVQAVELATGKTVWELNLRETFGVEAPLKWGYCASPLIVEGKLILNPGGPKASLVALDPATGKVLWKTPGTAPSYGSMLAGTFGGKLQIVGYDEETLGGWDVTTGQRLWTLKFARSSPFNVPTPVQVGDRLLICHENLGTALYEFARDGKIVEKPVATFRDLAPDSHTPVVVGDRVYGVWQRLFCLDVKAGLKPIWESDDDAYAQYAGIVASEDRLLVTTQNGELILVDAKGEKYRELGRLPVLPGEKGCLAHPALVGKRLYLRGNTALYAVELAP